MRYHCIIMHLIQFLHFPYAQLLTLQETLNEPAAPVDHSAPKQYSKGRAHSALVQTGLAAKQVQKAQRVMQLKTNQSQNIAKAVFSHWARGKNSSNHNQLFLASDFSTSNTTSLVHSILHCLFKKK